MHHDVTDLRHFYEGRALGRVAQRLLRDRVAAWWPAEALSGMSVAGYGYAVPVMRPWLTKARRVLALMPASQGVLPWPVAEANSAALVDPAAWPLDTGILDRLVLLHGLETSDDPSALLAEAWRVLGPGGRMLVLAPNRTGLWARSEATPFGTGRSYTAGQLEAQVRAAGFVPERLGAALYIPPSERRFWLGAAQGWERAGGRFASVLVAGVVLAEFSKQVHALIPQGRRVQLPSPLQVLDGIARPRPGAAPVRQGHRRAASPQRLTRCR